MESEALREAAVTTAFCRYLKQPGWEARTATAQNYCDVIATRGGVTLYAEAKGHTNDPGTDADTLYGQLLRRMIQDASATIRYAVVVPEGRALTSALRVPAPVRLRLGIEVYAVSADAQVRRVEEER